MDIKLRDRLSLFLLRRDARSRLRHGSGRRSIHKTSSRFIDRVKLWRFRHEIRLILSGKAQKVEARMVKAKKSSAIPESIAQVRNPSFFNSMRKTIVERIRPARNKKSTTNRFKTNFLKSCFKALFLHHTNESTKQEFSLNKSKLPVIPKKLQKMVSLATVAIIILFLAYNTGVFVHLYNSIKSSLAPSSSQATPSPPTQSIPNNTNIDLNYITIGLNSSGGVASSLIATPSINGFNVTPGTVQAINLSLALYNVSIVGGTSPPAPENISAVESGTKSFNVSIKSPVLPITVNVGSIRYIYLAIKTPSIPYKGTLNIILDVKAS